MLENITPLILAYNEAANIERTLEQLHWARDIVVVDSFSDDDTLEIISGFPQVRIHQRKFDSHENQWNFGLNETGINSEWVLGLDADYILTEDLAAELGALQPAPEISAYRAKFVYCVNGKRLRSGIYPPVTVLYRKSSASYIQEGHTQRLVTAGEIDNLRCPILHDDRKSLTRWLEAQSRYTKLEADKLLSSPESSSWTDHVRRWRLLAPPAMLFYCLIVRGGVLDGWAGFYYAFQRSLAELMIALYLVDHDLRNAKFGIRNSASATRQRIEKEDAEIAPVGQQFPIGNPKSEIRNS
jgi:glycosyltransferase involved in cell wall biosynthesis